MKALDLGVWTFVLIKLEAQKAHDNLPKPCEADWHKIELKKETFHAKFKSNITPLITQDFVHFC